MECAQGSARKARSLRADVPAQLDAILAKMLARNPENRYQSPDEVAEALEPYCRSGGPETTVGSGSSAVEVDIPNK